MSRSWSRQEIQCHGDEHQEQPVILLPNTQESNRVDNHKVGGKCDGFSITETQLQEVAQQRLLMGVDPSRISRRVLQCGSDTASESVQADLILGETHLRVSKRYFAYVPLGVQRNSRNRVL
jgi:hypothetical protein